MTIEIKVPVLPESVSDATIATWHKKPGESIKRDEHLVDIETDKVVLEVVAPNDGTLEKILKAEGETVKADEVIGLFNPGEVKSESKPESKKESSAKDKQKEPLSPSARRLVSEQNVDVSQIKGSGKEGRITKEDILKGPGVSKEPQSEEKASISVSDVTRGSGERLEKRVPMSRLRARIAERLVEAQHTAAILTTFNEINMQPVMNLRQKYKESFEKTHGVRLGFMSFFTLAVVEALKRFPIVNASIDGQDILYHEYFDIGIAVSSPRGLVVPVIRNTESLHMADIEKQIAEFGQKAKEGRLTMEEISRGTFTISNGGVFGSLMSTPIINPPQSAILGMHKIEERPVVENGQIVIRPMMYVALSYDHRIIDGSESVKFLVTIKEMLEDPALLLLDI